jgi:predicted ester cyclase
MPKHIEDLYHRFLKELWHADLDQVQALAAEIVTPDFVVHQARLGEPSEEVRGPAALARLVLEGRAPFSDVEVTIDVGPVSDGDLVAARWTFRGTYQGGIPGATAPPGTPFRFSGIDLLRAEGDRLAEYWVSSDAVQAMAQLEMADGPATGQGPTG